MEKKLEELMNKDPVLPSSGGDVNLNNLNTMFVNRTAFDHLVDRVRNLEVNDSK